MGLIGGVVGGDDPIARDALPYDAESVVASNAAVTANTSGGGVRVIALSDTLAVFASLDAAKTTLRLVAASIAAGGGRTYGTAVTVTKNNDNCFDIKALSATKFVVMVRTSSTVVVLKTYTVSGTTITLDATSTNITTIDAKTNCAIGVLSSTRIFIAYATASTIYTVKGGAIGSGSITLDTGSSTITVVNTNLSDHAQPYFLKIDSSKLFLFYTENTSGSGEYYEVYYSHVTDNGSGVAPTVTAKTVADDRSYGQRSRISAAIVNTSNVILFSASSGGGFGACFVGTGTFTGAVITWLSITNKSAAPFNVMAIAETTETADENILFGVCTDGDDDGVVIMTIGLNKSNRRTRFGYGFPANNAYAANQTPCDITMLSSSRMIVTYLQASTAYPVSSVVDF